MSPEEYVAKKTALEATLAKLRAPGRRLKMPTNARGARASDVRVGRVLYLAEGRGRAFWSVVVEKLPAGPSGIAWLDDHGSCHQSLDRWFVRKTAR